MPFEQGYKGGANDMLLDRLANGWVPARPETLPGGKRIYMRTLFYAYGWSRMKLMQVFQVSPGQVGDALKVKWRGLEQHEKLAAPTDIPPDIARQVQDWKRLYESALQREERWRATAVELRATLDAATEHAERLAHSHPARLEKVQGIGKEMLKLLTGKQKS